MEGAWRARPCWESHRSGLGRSMLVVPRVSDQTRGDGQTAPGDPARRQADTLGRWPPRPSTADGWRRSEPGVRGGEAACARWRDVWTRRAVGERWRACCGPDVGSPELSRDVSRRPFPCGLSRVAGSVWSPLRTCCGGAAAGLLSALMGSCPDGAREAPWKPQEERAGRRPLRSCCGSSSPTAWRDVAVQATPEQWGRAPSRVWPHSRLYAGAPCTGLSPFRPASSASLSRRGTPGCSTQSSVRTQTQARVGFDFCWKEV